MKLSALCILLLAALSLRSQNPYADSLNVYISNYVIKHEVVTGDDKSKFRFFPPDSAFRVTARIEKVMDSKWFTMETSGTIRKTFRIYGILFFSIKGSPVTLPIYQSQNLMQMDEYKDLLFLPFTDLTSGEETYAAGRYIDINISDIVNKTVVIDFNKAYNPYCAYVSGKYNCPVPPKENQLNVAIEAGEKNFRK